MKFHRLPKGSMLQKAIRVILICGVIIFLLAPFVPGLWMPPEVSNRARLLSGVNAAQNIHKAAFMMAQEAAVKESDNYGWPGDLYASGKITNVSDYMNRLVGDGFLPVGALKTFAGSEPKSGFIPYEGEIKGRGKNAKLDPPFRPENCAFKIYLVKKSDGDNALFLVSKNYTYNQPLNAKSKPYGKKGFVVVRKDGSGAALRAGEVDDLEYIGLLPGQTDSEYPVAEQIGIHVLPE